MQKVHNCIKCITQQPMYLLLEHRFEHFMSNSGVQFLSTTWYCEQDEQRAHPEVSSLLENENLGWHGWHITNVLGFIRFPHSSERPCPGGQDGQSSHEVEPSKFSTQYWVSLQGFICCKKSAKISILQVVLIIIISKDENLTQSH